MAKALKGRRGHRADASARGRESATLNFAVGPFASMLDRARDLIKQATE